MGGVRDGGDQGRVDHSRTEAQEGATQQPPLEATGRDGDEDPSRLRPRTRHDQALASPAVSKWSGRDLQCSPHRRVDGLQDPDTLDPEAEAGEEQGEDAPAHAVVKVIDEARLRAGEEVAVLEG